MPHPGRREAHARDNTPSKMWAMKIPAPTRPITAVTISNIANILCAPHEQNDAQARTVKRISRARRTEGGKWGFSATGCAKTGQGRLLIVAELQPFIHQAEADPISAVISLRYLYNLMRRWDRVVETGRNCLALGRHPVEW
jgi:hypothetical protein